MTNNISDRDWKMISAYLDGQLSGRKLVHLESRLSQEPDLRNALDELHKTRQVLRSAPSLQVPRNFLLTHQMVGQPRHLPRLAPAFGWTSAAASMLLVILLVGDFFSSAGVIPVAWNNVPRQSVALSQEVADDAGRQAYAEPAALDAPGLGGVSEASNNPDVILNVESQETPEMDAAAAAAIVPQETDESIATAQLPPPEGEGVSVLVEEDPTTSEMPSEPETAAPKVFTDTVRLGEGEEFLSASLVPSQTITTEVALKDEFMQAEAEPSIEPTETEIVTSEGRHIEKTPTIPVVDAFPEEIALPPEEISPTEEQLPTLLPEPTAVMVAKVAPEMEPEIYIAEEQMPDEFVAQVPVADEPSRDFLVGLEVGVGLLAFSTAVAWIYLRRRGG